MRQTGTGKENRGEYGFSVEWPKKENKLSSMEMLRNLNLLLFIGLRLDNIKIRSQTRDRRADIEYREKSKYSDLLIIYKETSLN
jgi:hypothetical protein